MPAGLGLNYTQKAEAVADIPTPGTATSADNANKINELLASLREAGILAE